MSGLLDLSPEGQQRYAVWKQEQEQERAREAVVAQIRAEQAAVLDGKLAAIRDALNAEFRQDIAVEFENDFPIASTGTARAREIRRFREYAAVENLPATWPLVPEVVASYLVERAGSGWRAVRSATVMFERESHRLGFPNPLEDILVRATMRGLRRWFFSKRKNKKELH